MARLYSRHRSLLLCRYPPSSFIRSKMYIDNPNLNGDQHTNLYHFGLCTSTHDFVQLFGDVKFVCCGGSPKRMEKLANMFIKEFQEASTAPLAVDLSQSDRYSIYKAGPVLCVNHGIGMPSMSVMLHELFKLLHHAKCQEVLLFRIGTCGGLDVSPGTIVVTERTYTALFERECYNVECIGKTVSLPAILDHQIRDELYDQAQSLNLPVVKGNTIGANCFYEAQGRLDGAMCSYNKAERMEFFEKAKSLGVRNFEMEAPAFAAMTHRAGVKAAVMCVTLLNRMESDQVASPKDVLKSYEDRLCRLLITFIKKKLTEQSNGTTDNCAKC